MNALTMLYPANPVNVPPSLIEPTASFRKEVGGVMGSIMLFFVVYLLMLMLAVALVIGCVIVGVIVILNVRHVFGILAGIGLIGLGVMVFLFLVKFLFAVSRFDRSGSIEVTEMEQPVLFAFIRQLTLDTQTPFPKKIYLSPEVNACVFYDSSFWSMFLPIRKNLQIGLGLVNSINVSEFKAVMAHEFGHFSQRSMKLGSFVYNVNRIIYNMLFQNTGYSNALGTFASAGSIFSIFASLTAWIARGIQYVLRQMYGVINKRYMSLSREMEFHADAVAASVSGSDPLVTALRRIELASAGYTITLQKCDALFREKKISGNIYLNQLSVMKRLAKEYKLEEEHGLPIITKEFHSSHNTSRVNYKDQWASHPTTDDREQHLQQLAVKSEINTQPAWAIFEDREALQSTLTMKVYEAVEISPDIQTVDNQEFERKVEGDITLFNIPEEYKGFYDNRQIELPPAEERFLSTADDRNLTFDQLLRPDQLSLPSAIRSAAGDLEVLRAIGNKTIQVKSFDFDGAKYGRGDALKIATQLETEMKEQEAKLKELDNRVIAWFITRAETRGLDASTLRDMYADYFQKRKDAAGFLEFLQRMTEPLNPIYQGTALSLESIQSIISGIKNSDEPALKAKLREWIQLGAFDRDLDGRALAQRFIERDYAYFDGTSFIETELVELKQLINESWTAVNSYMFFEFKKIVEYQLPLAKLAKSDVNEGGRVV